MASSYDLDRVAAGRAVKALRKCSVELGLIVTERHAANVPSRLQTRLLNMAYKLEREYKALERDY